MYSTVRRCSNIILIAGSGFGGADDTEPYLTGEWALKFAHPPMPFDGVLFGSRVMTALEARTSLAVCYLFTYLLSVGEASDCRCSRSRR
jgi:fatty acid synthase subunit beta